MLRSADHQQIAMLIGFMLMSIVVSGGCREAAKIESRRVPKPVVPVVTVSSQDPRIQYKAPDQWQPGPQVVSRGGITVRHVAAFQRTEGDESVDITIDALPGFAGNMISNINRWRRQLGLAPTSRDELKDQLTTIQVGKQDAQFVEIVGDEKSNPRLATLGAIVEGKEVTWFIKMKGHLALAEKEKPRFEAFVESIQLSQTPENR